MSHDVVTQFIKCFDAGNVLEALQSVLPSSEISFDEVPTQNASLLTAIANYSEVTTLASPVEGLPLYLCYLPLFVTNFQLQKKLIENGLLRPFTQGILKILTYEAALFKILNAASDDEFEKEVKNLHPEMARYLLSIRFGTLLTEQEIQAAIHVTPLDYRKNFSKQIALSQAWAHYRMNRPTLTAKWTIQAPWHPFRFPIIFSPDLENTEGTPVIFLEPSQSNFERLFHFLKNQPSILVFETQINFIQMLQEEFGKNIISDPKHLIYILEFYPNFQFDVQPWREKEKLKFSPIFYTSNSQLKSGAKLLIDLIQKCLNQTGTELKTETSLGNWLYRVSKNILFNTREHRLGISRSPAFVLQAIETEWHSPYKGLPPSNVDLGTPSKDNFGKLLEKLSLGRSVRKLEVSKKIKLAHIMPQLLDVGNAPSRLLETLLTFYNKEKYEIILICTERLVWHLQEYPLTFKTSESSKVRAKNLLQRLSEYGITIYIADTDHSFEETAQMISQILNKHEIDIAVFHGPDVINLMCAQMTNVPIRVLFEHGSHTKYRGFDVTIVSTQDALQIYEELFKKIETKAFVLPFAVDLRKQWPAEPPTRFEMGLPENGFYMTTISHNLDSRLGKEMCLAIAEILRRYPNAYYTPMGEAHDEARFLNFFKEFGVAERVIFLGVQTNPSHVSRAMNLYLNEFPFGSCLAILDAMAAGCPVVTMYDVNGPQQARYGGIFFGMERAITSGDRSDYVELACRLIEDKEVYEEWSKHAIQQYEAHINTQKYVSDFENILEIVLKDEHV